jgi:hypothetical protein
LERFKDYSACAEADVAEGDSSIYVVNGKPLGRVRAVDVVA